MAAGRTALRWLERLLFTVAAVSLGVWMLVTLTAWALRARADRRLDALVHPRPGVARATPAGRRSHVERGDVLGRIEVPRVGLSAVIVEGDGDLTLSFAAGHIPGTALPGENGNIALAGHRDSIFRGLAHIRRADTVSVITPRGTYRYVVESTRIVSPKDVGVLGPTPRPELTLVTCYPFHYIGSAPKRFVVTARLVHTPKSAASPVASR
jgi:sortase A